VSFVKVWYHLIAAVVGLAVAALIVYLVFGSASEQGATQDGDAGALAASETLCGTVKPADTSSPTTRKLAGENLPSLSDAKGPFAAISDEQPKQQDWVERVHAASGLCIDELEIVPEGTAISMSTVDGVSEADAQQYVAGTIAQAFTPPLNPRRVTLVSTVGDSERTILISARAWRAYQARRRQLGIPHSIANLKLFRQASGYKPVDLRIVGW
jgi:hypothetical protein